MQWDAYFQKTHDGSPSKYLVEAVKKLPANRRSRALDLGCGAGRDSRFLLSQGFEVMAIDADADAEHYLEDLSDNSKFRFTRSTIEDFQFGSYDLVNASNALPFVSSEKFDALWQRIGESILPGGMFVGELFGVNDTWNTGDGQMNFHDRAMVEQLLAEVKIYELVEEENDRPTALGQPKHWHVFHIIAGQS